MPLSDLHRLILDRAEQGLIAIDPAGELILCNGAAQRLLGRVPSSAPLAQWAERCGVWRPDHSARPELSEFPLTRAVLGDSSTDVELCVAHERAQRCTLVRASGMPLRGAGGSVRGGVMLLRGATSHTAQRPPADFLALSRTVAAAARECPSAADALRVAVDAICTAIGWPVAHVLWREEGGTGLVSSGVWHLDAAREAFRTALEGKRACAGPGLIGDVLRSSKPAWASDLSAPGGGERLSAAAEAGLRAAAALPIVTSNGIVGVLELFHDRPVAHDAQLLRQLGEVVSLLGPLFERDFARRREQFLALVVDNVAHPIFVKDRDYRFVLLNKALCEMVGHSREEMLGKTDYDFFSKAEADFFREKDLEMFRSGSPVVIDEEPITDAKGSLHVLATTKVPLRGPSGEVTHLAGIIHDITRLRAAEEGERQLEREQFARAAAETEQRRSALLATASRLMATSLDFERTLEVAARLAVPEFADCCSITLAGQERHRVLECPAWPGQSAFADLASYFDAEAFRLAASVIRTGTPELLARSRLPNELVPDGDRTFSLVSVPLITRGQTQGALTFLRLGAKRQFAPEELSVAEQLGYRVALALDNAKLYAEAREAVQVRDEFLSIASHELRTPLSTLKLQAARLLALAGAGSAAARGLEAMQRQIDRLSVLINNLLDVTRLAAGRLELNLSEFELSAAVREVAERMSMEADQAGSSVRVIAPSPVTGRWDQLRVEQVVTNLLSNAVKYGGGKPIEITVEPVPSGARVRVRDHGIGIAEEDLRRIFERFERAGATHRYAGLGLGLHISRQIVRAHGGTITVTSRPGDGSTFIVELPSL